MFCCSLIFVRCLLFIRALIASHGSGFKSAVGNFTNNSIITYKIKPSSYSFLPLHYCKYQHSLLSVLCDFNTSYGWYISKCQQHIDGITNQIINFSPKYCSQKDYNHGFCLPPCPLTIATITHCVAVRDTNWPICFSVLFFIWMN